MKLPFGRTAPKASNPSNQRLGSLSHAAKLLLTQTKPGRIKQSRLDLLLTAFLLAASVWNSWCFLRQSFHWPLFAEDELTRLDRDLHGVKTVLSELHDRNIGYRIEETSQTYDTRNFFKLQYMLAPSILWHEPSDNRYVIVEFWTTRKVKPLPGLMLLKDLGYGFALYRRL